MISVEFRDWVNEKVMHYLPKNSVKTGDKIICRCPICGDSKKNTMKKRGYYYLKTSSYHCFNCEANYTGMKLLEVLSGEDYNTLHKEYVNMMYDGKHFCSVAKMASFDKNDKGKVLYHLKNVIKPEWKHELSDKAKEYLKNRGVLEAPFLKEELYSYFTKKGDEYILIPWRINGIDCYFQLNDFEKHNKSGMKYIFPKNKDKMIYGLDNIDLSMKYIIVFEGVYDSLFVKNGVCLGGKNITEFQYDLIKRRYPNHRICLALDNDLPGLTSAAKILMDKSKPNEFSFFKWFSDDTTQKDINDYVIYKNNVNIFKDRKIVESCIVDPIVMKMWLMKKGLIK